LLERLNEGARIVAAGGRYIIDARIAAGYGTN